MTNSITDADYGNHEFSTILARPRPIRIRIVLIAAFDISCDVKIGRHKKLLPFPPALISPIKRRVSVNAPEALCASRPNRKSPEKPVARLAYVKVAPPHGKCDLLEIESAIVREGNLDLREEAAEATGGGWPEEEEERHHHHRQVARGSHRTICKGIDY
ncbi:P-loop containing nucleoside triphosphatehydrolases superfamily protein [Striga asiatica]|uniref:P-loop containing nucleoside triphosphatehydrolases superfamily protein n=1 Tax=Striga asiatica TaxID=4170 RepID=A0A5A7PVZ5_STRAF|nr:P-loop containing nucleoside triphosphatehydrolases superfamily protein [Striga asiatica]